MSETAQPFGEHPFAPIGVVHSCFTQKFGIPRQAGLAPAAEAQIELFPPWDREEALRGLEGFSHLWVLFLFHRCLGAKWRPTVRPPRLGGNRRVGVFATRSPFRPNPLGLSAVALRGIQRDSGGLLLHLTGVDILDGTPVLDIKPYLPYTDCVSNAIGGFADSSPGSSRAIHFSEAAEAALRSLPPDETARLRLLIGQVLAQDPRPAYLEGNDERRDFAMRLWDYEVRWQIEPEGLVVQSIQHRSGN